MPSHVTPRLFWVIRAILPLLDIRVQPKHMRTLTPCPLKTSAVRF